MSATEIPVRKLNNGRSGRSHNLHGIEEKIASAEAISFDFFDTLFVRTLLDPEDVFDILGKRFGINNFRKLRREAQARAFRRMREAGRREITLEGIYDCFEKAGFSIEELIDAEYRLELALVHPNRELVDLFLDAVRSEKRVVITSDMYLPVEFFRESLRQHNLPAVPMFISADRNATKRDCGELFDVLVAELGLSPERILHVGDNVVSDIKQANAKGLATFHYTEHRRPPKRKHSSLECSIASGLLRKHGDQIPPGSARELGLLYGGPAAVAFLEWIAEQARQDKIDRVLFLARDGYCLHRIAQARADNRLPPHDYFLGSRVAFTLAAMTESNFLKFIPFLLSGAEELSVYEVFERIGVSPPASSLMEMFGLEANAAVTGTRRALLEEFLYINRWEILKICRKNRRALFVYLNKLGITPGTRVALVDVGWSGTTQDALETAVAGLMELEVFGYYFCLSDTPERLLRQESRRMSALISTSSISSQLVARTYLNRAAVELFFSAPHQSVIGLSLPSRGVVQPVEDCRKPDVDVLLHIKADIASGMEDFACSFEALRKQLKIPVSPIDLAMPLLEFITNDEWKKHKILQSVKNFDGWSLTRNRDKSLCDY